MRVVAGHIFFQMYWFLLGRSAGAINSFMSVDLFHRTVAAMHFLRAYMEQIIFDTF